jgi:hypothetical protein
MSVTTEQAAPDYTSADLDRLYEGWLALVRRVDATRRIRGTMYGIERLAPGETLHMSLSTLAGDKFTGALRASASAFARRTDRTIVVNAISARQRAGRGTWQEVQVTRLD